MKPTFRDYLWFSLAYLAFVGGVAALIRWLS